MPNKRFDYFIEKCESVWNKINLSQKDRDIITQSIKHEWWKFDMPPSLITKKHIKNATLLFLANKYKNDT